MGRFARTGAAGASAEVELSSEQIGTITGIGKSAAYRAVKAAIERGFLVNNETRPRKPFRLAVRQRIDETAPRCCRIRTRSCRKGAAP